MCVQTCMYYMNLNSKQACVKPLGIPQATHDRGLQLDPLPNSTSKETSQLFDGGFGLSESIASIF